MFFIDETIMTTLFAAGGKQTICKQKVEKC